MIRDKKEELEPNAQRFRNLFNEYSNFDLEFFLYSISSRSHFIDVIFKSTYVVLFIHKSMILHFFISFLVKENMSAIRKTKSVDSQ